MREGYKFSVIIPTMWCSDLIFKLLDSLNNNDMVGEIILIDNDKSKRPPQITSTAKLRIIEQEENIYVNPAWNLGVELANYPNICISNDDLVWNVQLLPLIFENIHLGIIGQATSNYFEDNDEIKIEPITERNWGWGCCFFIEKDKWVKIPSELKVACGDDWLLSKIIGYQISGTSIETEPHPWSVSRTASKNEFVQLSFQDMGAFSRL
jgi:glycosyltransferase involved in cell wall biosynthesis